MYMLTCISVPLVLAARLHTLHEQVSHEQDTDGCVELIAGEVEVFDEPCELCGRDVVPIEIVQDVHDHNHRQTATRQVSPRSRTSSHLDLEAKCHGMG